MKTEGVFIRNLSMSYEDAYDAVNAMTDVQEVTRDGVTVHSGFHPEHGAIHVIIPALGDGMMLLPFALRDI